VSVLGAGMRAGPCRGGCFGRRVGAAHWPPSRSREPAGWRAFCQVTVFAPGGRWWLPWC